MSNGKKRKRDHSFTFRSLEHEKRYKTSILNQNFVQERAIALKPDEYREISNQVKIRNWETLISYPKPASKQLLKEFYANAYQDENFTTYVRGKSIQFDPQTLNEFLKIKNPTTCGYMKLKGENVNAGKYLEILCKPGAQWKLSKENKPKKLNSTDLKPVPKAWSSFVHHTLLPCANDSDVTVRRAQLLYAIVTGLEIDVGSVIARNIQEIADDKSASLGYSSLITQLCLDSGVEVGEEFQIKPKWPITAKYIEKCTTTRAEQPPPPPPLSSRQEEKEESLSLEQRVKRLEDNVGALCKLAIMILQSQQSLQTMVRSLGEQLHLDVYTMGGLSSTEADILAQINFNAMESESKEGPAEAEPSCPKQEPREEDGLEED